MPWFEIKMRPLEKHFLKTKESWKLKINSIAIEIQQQYFLSLNSMAPQVPTLIEAGQDNQWKKKKITLKKFTRWKLQINKNS